MPKTPPPVEFKIHVDSSCLTDSTDLQMAPVERVVSDQTVVHHDSWREEKPVTVEDKAEDDVEAHKDAKYDAEDEKAYHEKAHHGDGFSDDENTQDARERQIDRIEAQIQAAARAVVASIEKDHYGGHDDSVLSTQTDESYEQEGSQITYNEGTELTYGDGTELTYDGTETSYEPHSDHEEEEAAGDSSSHHDGDIDDDDVFSRNSGHSARSSLNSIHDLSSADEIPGKALTSPTVGEEAIHSSPAPEEQETISRIPSSSSYTPRDATPVTPSKVLSRPPFRTPSSVRAMQMSSPTQSLFSSPRSSKRHLPTVSRIGTPSSLHSPSKNRTPTRFKVKKEYPLVLLHVTVLPLAWNYSHVISSLELPLSLQRVKENWRLLQEKLGDTVLERGILLPHPQDSYEVLEERLLEALELPVRPRARILKCGHYMGPETPTSSDEEGKAYFEGGTKVDGDRRWCDICVRDVRLEGVDVAGRVGEKRFRIKIYASNGLMRAGAWAACWREMERVDVEIEPFVDGHLVAELEEFAAVAVIPQNEEGLEEEGDGFVDEDGADEPEHARDIDNHGEQEEQMRAQQEEEMARALIEEEELRQRAHEEEDMRRKIQDEQRMREIYGQDAPSRQQSRSRPSRRASSRSTLDDDSLPDLLLKAFKVAMRDKKNIAICVLSIIILLLALRPGSNAPKHSQVIMADSGPVLDIVTEAQTSALPNIAEVVSEPPKSVDEVPRNIQRDVPIANAKANTHIATEFAVETEDATAKEAPVMDVEENLKETSVPEEVVSDDTVKEISPSPELAAAQSPIAESADSVENTEQASAEE